MGRIAVLQKSRGRGRIRYRDVDEMHPYRKKGGSGNKEFGRGDLPTFYVAIYLVERVVKENGLNPI